MSDNKDNFLAQLCALGLEHDEAEIYLELLHQPSTPLQLSRETGISRTKIYHLVDVLEKRSLVGRTTDDRGTFLVASDPSTLEVALTAEEQKLQQQRAIFKDLMPSLAALNTQAAALFTVRTYEGEEGIKQMCWHELKTKGELLVMGGGTIEEMVPNHRWAEKHRRRSTEAGYHIRELVNEPIEATFTSNPDFMKLYASRIISKEMLPLVNQTSTYNDTVVIYHWREAKKVGIEIISPPYAAMMRAIFEHFWALAAPSYPVPA